MSLKLRLYAVLSHPSHLFLPAAPDADRWLEGGRFFSLDGWWNWNQREQVSLTSHDCVGSDWELESRAPHFSCNSLSSAIYIVFKCYVKISNNEAQHYKRIDSLKPAAVKPGLRDSFGDFGNPPGRRLLFHLSGLDWHWRKCVTEHPLRLLPSTYRLAFYVQPRSYG